MEDLTGKQLGQYRVVAPLGEGGMAAVYKAYQPGMDRYVALKILPQHFAKDPLFVGRFQQEAKVLAKLQHLHILPVFDYGEAEGYTYIVMPFVESGTLTDLLKGQPLPLKQIRALVSQIGDALDYAHSLGLVHRDVKPSNVLIDARGNCLLTDFGIAKIVEGTAKFTGTGGIIGTPAYMSPEQGRGDKVDARTDVYALGVMLYEMVTGRVPFDAETPIAIVFKHIQDPLPPPSTLNPDIPDALERVILKALAKDPNDRFAATGEMVQALQAALPDVTQPAIPAPTVPEKKIPPPTPALRPKWLLPAIGAGAAVACLALIAVIGGAFMTGLIGGTPAPTTPFIVAAAPATTAAPNVIASPTFVLEAVATPTVAATPVPPAASLPFTCTDAIGCVDIAPGAPIHIAYALPISGATAPLGAASKGAIEIAIDDKGGELLGHKIELTGEDTLCNAEGGQAAGTKLAADPTIVGIIGTNCSSEARAAMPQIAGAGMVMISPSNTNPDLTNPDPPDHPPG
ncbi:MAG: bifunctional serine/threonine-protein kinase/ABC transporter substrate-binding protein, partial [Chloroflexota bacterium]